MTKMKSIIHGAVIAAHALVLVAAAPVTSAQTMQQLPSFVDLYEQQGAAVVSIKVATNANSRNSGARRFNLPDFDLEEIPEQFRRFFQQPNPRGERNQPEQRDRGPQVRGAGSGFIISPDGFIVTNHHVVDGADEVIVTLTDKREFKAKVVGSDSRTDTALLKIDATGLTAVRVGDPSRMKVGEWVVAIGQPFGLENTLTKGIISAKGRNNVGDRDTLASFIQHDAAVNPGNSGGPLFNLRGEVIGVNSMIYSRTGGFQGLSFAVPIDQAMDVVKQLQATGRVQRGKLGVSIGSVSKDVAESFGLPKSMGALVGSVEKDSAAEKAGIRERDVIVKFDGKPVPDNVELPRMVTSVKPGTKVPVEVWRDGKMVSLSVQLGEFKDEPKTAGLDRSKSSAGEKSKARLSRMDMNMNELTAEEKKALGVKGGVRIDDIKGKVRLLEEDDVITAVIYKGITTEVSTPDQLEKALAKADKGGTVTFQVKRAQRAGGFATIFVPEHLGDS